MLLKLANEANSCITIEARLTVKVYTHKHQHTHTLAVELNEAFLVLCKLSSAGNLINLPLQNGDLPVPPSLQGTQQ